MTSNLVSIIVATTAKGGSRVEPVRRPELVLDVETWPFTEPVRKRRHPASCSSRNRLIRSAVGTATRTVEHL